MSDNNKKNDGSVKTPDGNPVKIVEKKGLLASAKEKASAFEAKHPKGVGMAKTTLKVAGGFCLGVAAKCGFDFLTGKNTSSSDPDYIPVEDNNETEVVFEEVNDDN